MRILHMIAGAEHGGAETYCLDAIKALDERGVEQHVICRPHSNYLETFSEKSISHSIRSFNKLLKWFEQNQIKKDIENFEPDIVHCWMNRASSFVPELNSTPIIGWFGGYYKLKYYKNCDYYIGVTKDIVRHIGQETGTPEKAYVVHTFGTLEDSSPVRKSEFDIPDESPVVLLLSRMHWKKGIDTLLQAAGKLDGVYFLLAGDGPDIEKYKNMAVQMNVEERVRFLGWRNDRAALLKIADVCVLPSRYEPFGTVIAEAWHASVPLVATKADGARQYVTHEKDGLLCEIDDFEGLAENINKALTNKNLKESLINSGQEKYKSLFSKEKVIENLLYTYKKIHQKTKR